VIRHSSDGTSKASLSARLHANYANIDTLVFYVNGNITATHDKVGGGLCGASFAGIAEEDQLRFDITYRNLTLFNASLQGSWVGPVPGSSNSGTLSPGGTISGTSYFGMTGTGMTPVEWSGFIRLQDNPKIEANEALSDRFLLTGSMGYGNTLRHLVDMGVSPTEAERLRYMPKKMQPAIYDTIIKEATLLASPTYGLIEMVGFLALEDTLGGNTSVNAIVKKDQSLFQQAEIIAEYLNNTAVHLRDSDIRLHSNPNLDPNHTPYHDRYPNRLASNPAITFGAALQCMMDSIDANPAKAIQNAAYETPFLLEKCDVATSIANISFTPIIFEVKGEFKGQFSMEANASGIQCEGCMVPQYPLECGETGEITSAGVSNQGDKGTCVVAYDSAELLCNLIPDCSGYSYTNNGTWTSRYLNDVAQLRRGSLLNITDYRLMDDASLAETHWASHVKTGRLIEDAFVTLTLTLTLTLGRLIEDAFVSNQDDNTLYYVRDQTRYMVLQCSTCIGENACTRASAVAAAVVEHLPLGGGFQLGLGLGLGSSSTYLWVVAFYTSL